MKKQTALHLLQDHKEAMRQRFGVRHLSLFGSTVRDEAREKATSTSWLNSTARPPPTAISACGFILKTCSAARST